MIPAAMITEWSQQCPWISSAQVEQDLILSRASVEIYRVPAFCESLIFRGGTALHKLVLQPAARYSEDLDFVQIREEPIGPTFDLLRDALEPWLGEPKTDISLRGATQIYRFESETPPTIRLRLKIEINTREHFHIHPLEERKFEVDSRWFNGSAQVPVSGNPSEHGWDLKLAEKKTEKIHQLIQVKTVSAFSTTRRMSPLHNPEIRPANAPENWNPWSALWLIFLDKKLRPTGFWRMNASEVEFNGKSSLRQCTMREPNKKTGGSNCFKWPENEIELYRQYTS